MAREWMTNEWQNGADNGRNFKNSPMVLPTLQECDSHDLREKEFWQNHGWQNHF